MKKRSRPNNGHPSAAGRHPSAAGKNKKRKTAPITKDPFFDSAHNRSKSKGKSKSRGKGEEIFSSEEDDDAIGRDAPAEDEEEEVPQEERETADEKRLRVAKAYLDKIRAITKANEENDEEEAGEDEETEAERRGKRDSLVAEILQQEQLEESGRVQRQLASRYPLCENFLYLLINVVPFYCSMNAEYLKCICASDPHGLKSRCQRNADILFG